MRRAPVGNVLVIVAAGDRDVNDKEQDLGEPVQNPTDVARFFNHREIVEQGRKARLGGRSFGGRNGKENYPVSLRTRRHALKMSRFMIVLIRFFDHLPPRTAASVRFETVRPTITRTQDRRA